MNITFLCLYFSENFHVSLDHFLDLREKQSIRTKPHTIPHLFPLYCCCHVACADHELAVEILHSLQQIDNFHGSFLCFPLLREQHLLMQIVDLFGFPSDLLQKQQYTFRNSSANNLLERLDLPQPSRLRPGPAFSAGRFPVAACLCSPGLSQPASSSYV